MKNWPNNRRKKVTKLRLFNYVKPYFHKDPEKKKEAEANKSTPNGAPPVDRNTKPVTVSDTVDGGGGMGYRVRDINDLPSMVRL